MGALITNRQNKEKINLENLRTTAQAVLDDLGCPEGELSILIVDDADIAELNETYLHRSGPTNVIAFPMREGDFPNISPHVLGDVVISAETARQEAQAAGIEFWDRFVQLLIHGVLHLFGYDHEGAEAEAMEMEKRAGEILEGIMEKGKCKMQNAKWLANHSALCTLL